VDWNVYLRVADIRHEGVSLIMKRLLTFVAVLLLPLSLWAMRPLSDFDLSNINNPLSLSINPDQAITINDNSIIWNDSDGISKFLLNSINLERSSYIYLNETGSETIETQTTTSRFHFLYVSWPNNDNFLSIQTFLIDPITLKDKTVLASAEDNIGFNNIKMFPVRTTHGMEYPDSLSTSSNSSYNYIIKSGDIEMRNTYINQTQSIINSGSWVDIKTR
jgi:hypothetical protein